jgi:hypothetical protein
MLIMRKRIGAAVRRGVVRRTAVMLAVVTAAGLALPLASAGPASAGGGSPITPPVSTTVVCGSNGCGVALSQISLTGDTGGGSQVPPVPLPPPPCVYNAIGDQVTGSALVIAAGTAGGPLDIALMAPYVVQAQALLKNPVDGEWYHLQINPADSPAEAAFCQQAPPYVFVQKGDPAPQPPVPPGLLARYAYDQFFIPPPTLTISPPGKGVVDLASYVWGRWPVSKITGREDVFQITASLGKVTVTVRATALPMTITVAGPGAPFTMDCGPNGSHAPVGHPPASAGAGTTPDCGVMWLGADKNASVTVSSAWAITWWANDGVVHTLPDIAITSKPADIAVSEIEGIN